METRDAVSDVIIANWPDSAVVQDITWFGVPFYTGHL